MDKIIIKGIEVFAYHGALSEENSLGQRFTIDITMKKDIRKACINDTLEDTVHYGFVHDDVVTLTKNNKFKLIEKLAEALERARLLNEQAEQLKEQADKLGKP
jgi:dihydroneopterin aldolase